MLTKHNVLLRDCYIISNYKFRTTRTPYGFIVYFRFREHWILTSERRIAKITFKQTSFRDNELQIIFLLINRCTILNKNYRTILKCIIPVICISLLLIIYTKYYDELLEIILQNALPDYYRILKYIFQKCKRLTLQNIQNAKRCTMIGW